MKMAQISEDFSTGNFHPSSEDVSCRNSSSALTEYDLIDSLFYMCDSEKTGQVCISRLIEYLKFTTSNISENDKDLSNLAVLMNPSGRESFISITHYRGIMKTWIDSIRIRQNHDRTLTGDIGTHIQSRAINTAQEMEDRLHYEEAIARPLDSDSAELQNKISDLQHQNKKLMEENFKLQQQLESHEESLSTAIIDAKTLQKKIKSLQEVVDLRQETLQENEDLKTAISKLQEKKKELETRVNQLERENVLYDNKNIELEKKFQSTKTQVESIKEQRQELHTSLVEHKHKLSRLQEEKSMQEIHLNERYNEVRIMKNQMENLSKTVNELQHEKNEIQLQYSQVQNELSILQCKPDSFDLQEPEEEEHRVMDCSSPTRPVILASSTPCKARDSICFELKNLLVTDQYLQSPLCAKEYIEEGFFNMTPLAEINEDDTCSLEEEDISVSTKDELTMEISKFADKYKQKQSDLLEEIEKHLKEAITDNEKNVSMDFQKNLRSETDKLTQKVFSLAKAKEIADSRITKLKEKIMKLKEDNQVLKKANDNAKLTLTAEWDRDSSIDNRLCLLKEALNKERSYVKLLGKELVEKNQAVAAFGNFQDSNEAVPSVESMLKEIERLKRTNLDLTDKYQKAELQIQDIEDDLYRSKEDLETQKLQCDEIEENLASCKLARQLDLKEIWRIVHKDIEKECIEDQKEASLLDVPDNLKEQISQEIKTLKTQLQKRQAALGILTKSSVQTPIYQTCSCFGAFTGSNASSPLVEALSIDYFNGNHPAFKCKKGTYNSEMDLYGCDKCQGNWKYGSSSLSNRSHNHRQHSHGETNNNSQTNLNKSVSSSSTSGAADLDLSTSTLKSTDGRTRRKEFQSLRWESDDVICRSTESQSSSATDSGVNYHVSSESRDRTNVDHNDNMFESSSNNLRRWSFNAAIANQNYASDDMVHYPRCRSQSFQAAIESGQRTPATDDNNSDTNFSSAFVRRYIGSDTFGEKRQICACGDNIGKCCKCEREESEPVEDYCWNDNMDPNSSYTSHSFSHISYPSSTGYSSSNDNRTSPKLTRKLSILIEEDDVLSDTDGVPTPKLLSSGQAFSALRHTDIPPRTSKRTDHPAEYERDNKRHCINASPMKHTAHSFRQESIQNQSVHPLESHCTVSSFERPPAQTSSCHFTERRVTPHSFSQPYRSSYMDNSGTGDTSSELSGTDISFKEVAPEKTKENVTNSRSQAEVKKDSEPNVSLTNELTSQLEKLSLDENNANMEARPEAKQKMVLLSPNLSTGDRLKHDTIAESPSVSPIKTSSPKGARTPSPSRLSPISPCQESPKTQNSPINGQVKTPVDDISPEARLVGSKLAKIRLEHLSKKREQMRCAKMPELKEAITENSPVPTTIITVREPSPPDTAANHNGESVNSGVIEPPPPSDEPVMPSLPNSFLQKLGLSGDSDKGADQISEQDVENKFTSLSLAFKTDKLTLEKRLEIQERSRDIAEQNVDKELKGLKDNLETLNRLCADSQIREILGKIQNHVDILEQSTARVSSRAEVFGAVQQEKRMSKAIEIMLSHVENVRMVHDRVNSELEDARRMIQDSRPYGSTGSALGEFNSLSRRSASVCQGVPNARVGRRRVSEIVQLPRALGGTGIPSFSQTASLDTSSLECKSQGLRKDPNDEDPKSRFKAVVANAAMKNVVTDTFRRTSMDRQGSVTPPKASVSRENSNESKSRDSTDGTLSKQNSKEEEAFQQGFRQGYKAQIGQELKSLREQQASVNTNLEELMDNIEDPPEEEERNIKDTIISKAWDMVPEWEIAGKRLRMTLAGLVFLMAICSIIMSFLPLGQASGQVFPQYKHMEQPPL